MGEFNNAADATEEVAVDAEDGEQTEEGIGETTARVGEALTTDDASPLTR